MYAASLPSRRLAACSSIPMSSITTNLVQTSSVTAPGIGFYSYIVQTDSQNYFDTTTSTFVPFSLAVTPQIPFTETPTGSGNWTWTVPITLPAWANGYYIISSFQQTVNSPAAAPYSIYIFQGMTPADYAATFTPLNQNTGGTNNLQYVSPSGRGIGGATIQVFTLTDYNANILNNPVGITTTNWDGTWTDSVMVPTGATYAVQYFIPNQWGPDVIDVTV